MISIKQTKDILLIKTLTMQLLFALVSTQADRVLTSEDNNNLTQTIVKNFLKEEKIAGAAGVSCQRGPEEVDPPIQSKSFPPACGVLLTGLSTHFRRRILPVASTQALPTDSPVDTTESGCVP